MKVKNVIVSALNIIGRADLASALSGGSVLTAEESETVSTLLYCFNAVEDELARKYMPLCEVETLSSKNGLYYYSAFLRAPVKIKSVTADGEKVNFQLHTQYMLVNEPKITVEYEFAPSKKSIDGDSDFVYGVGEYLLALGAAAEYCLINGEVEASELWESKYRKEIDTAQSRLPSGGNIPPRRWI